MSQTPLVVLLAEDYTPDIRATQRAWKKSAISNPLMVVRDGEECLDYLYQRSGYTPENAPRPGLLLLDIKMPKMDGLAVLGHIRESTEFSRLPVVMLTSSQEQRDVLRSYDLRANAYIVKPMDFDSFCQATRAINLFWVLVENPEHHKE